MGEIRKIHSITEERGINSNCGNFALRVLRSFSVCLRTFFGPPFGKSMKNHQFPCYHIAIYSEMLLQIKLITGFIYFT